MGYQLQGLRLWRCLGSGWLVQWSTGLPPEHIEVFGRMHITHLPPSMLSPAHHWVSGIFPENTCTGPSKCRPSWLQLDEPHSSACKKLAQKQDPHGPKLVILGIIWIESICCVMLCRVLSHCHMKQPQLEDLPGFSKKPQSVYWLGEIGGYPAILIKQWQALGHLWAVNRSTKHCQFVYPYFDDEEPWYAISLVDKSWSIQMDKAWINHAWIKAQFLPELPRIPGCPGFPSRANPMSMQEGRRGCEVVAFCSPRGEASRTIKGGVRHQCCLKNHEKCWLKPSKCWI